MSVGDILALEANCVMGHGCRTKGVGMPLSVVCPACGNIVETKWKLNRRIVRCRYCGRAFWLITDDGPPHLVRAVKREKAKKPRVNYPEAFVWWARRYRGRRFPFRCLGCGVVTSLNQRVVMSSRKCPGCGRRITLGDIDRQLEAMEPERQRIMSDPFGGCLTAGGVILVATLLTCRLWLA